MKKFLFCFMVFLLSFSICFSHWKECGNGLNNIKVRALAITGDTIYAATYGAGVFITTDMGANWLPRNSGMENDSLSSIAIGKSGLFAASYKNGVYRSTDFGSTWEFKNNGIDYTRIYSLAAVDEKIYCGTNMSGLFYSSDNGESWSNKYPGMSPYIAIMSLYVNNELIMIGMQPKSSPEGFGLYMSQDDCESWENLVGVGVHTDFFLNVRSLQIKDNIIFAATLFGGIYSTSNFGKIWEFCNNGLPLTEWTGFAWILSTIGGDLYLGTLNNGVFRTTNNGLLWEDMNFGFSFKTIRDIKQCGQYVFLATDSGLYRSKISELAVEDDENGNKIKSAYFIYPNPASEYIELKIDAEHSQNGIQIYNSFGQRVIQAVVNPAEQNIRLNIESLPPGVYLLRCGEKAGMFVKE